MNSSNAANPSDSGRTHLIRFGTTSATMLWGYCGSLNTYSVIPNDSRLRSFSRLCTNPGEQVFEWFMPSRRLTDALAGEEHTTGSTLSLCRGVRHSPQSNFYYKHTSVTDVGYHGNHCWQFVTRVSLALLVPLRCPRAPVDRCATANRRFGRHIRRSRRCLGSPSISRADV